LRTQLSACRIILVLLLGIASLQAQFRISEDRDLKEYDLTGWDCRERVAGSARTPDGVERNQLKNRSPIDLAGRDIPSFDTAGFLRNVSAFDAATKKRRRKDLNPVEREQLGALEQQVVSLSGFLVLAYAGPPESTNCGNIDIHDWHLEIFERPLDHSPGIGDPTPIICEITPRTQNALFRQGVSMQKLAGFFRRPDLESEATGHSAQQVRITGFLTWDDEHNGASDVGTTIQRIGQNKYHQPWRSSAWEIHPVLKIEPANTSTTLAAPQPAAPTATAAAVSAATLMATPPPAPAQQEVTIIQAVKVKIAYGEAVLPRGMKLPLISRDGQTARVKYMGETVIVPVQSTDLH
jgi:hypothetical protein